MIRRTFDAADINPIVNHPAVLPSLALGAFDEIDMQPLLDNQRNICLFGEFGGAILVWTGPGIYDAHDFILPEGRGKWAKSACRLMLQSVFDHYGARMIWAQTPVENRACRMFNRLLGFKSEGIETIIPIPGHPPHEVEMFVMEKSQCP